MAEAALFSVYDRAGAIELAGALARNGWELYATGGTCAHLREAGLDVLEVGEVTGFPALFDGRVKTLHPKIFGGILADRANPAHRAQAQEHRIPAIGIVVVNLYPFEATVAREGATLQEAIEQIDIGGVSLVRAAAKNYDNVTVLMDPSQYDEVKRAMPGGLDLAARRRLAMRAFERTAEYDAAIARYMEAGLLANELPGSLALSMPLSRPLRYGENPQLRAAFYLPREDKLPEQLWGKTLSYNNLLDLDACLRLLVEAPIPDGLDRTKVRQGVARAAIVKHTIPCGVAQAPTPAEALRAAFDADPISAFGGIVTTDATIDAPAAHELSEYFLEIVAAPNYTDEALVLLKKKKNLRIMRFRSGFPREISDELQVRSALGGVLAEDEDPNFAKEGWRVVSKRAPTDAEWSDLFFAWDVVRHVKSNGIVIVRDGITRGICAGQTNRVSAVRIAGERAAAFAQGAACASDGFFPFPDGLLAAAQPGVSAVVAPQGSIRDAQVIAAADASGIALVFSTHRYFLH